jgi:molecular chaperone DnaJ
MSKADYYQTLGVGRSAAADEIKRAYRKLAMQYHPDRNRGDTAAEQKFKDVNEAYEVLKDDQKRAAYDRYGHEGLNAGMGGGRSAGGFEFSAGFAEMFDEMFGEFMGSSQRGRRRGTVGQRGADLRYDLEITLEEAFQGKHVTLNVPGSKSCSTCNGSGAAPGTGTVSCTLCHGHGKIRSQQGFFTVERSCPQCGGAGSVIEKPCGDCQGRGRVAEDKQLEVDIPAGIESGTRIRLNGEGEAGIRGGGAGDLYVFLGIKPHPVFERQSSDLACRVTVPMTLAALGGSVEITGITGDPLKVTVPEGTQSGQRVRLKGKGMSTLRSSHVGDLHVELAVQTPAKLNKKQKELLRAFAEARNETDALKAESSGNGGVLDKVKELWQDLTD